jgi:hypothetical protein
MTDSSTLEGNFGFETGLLLIDRRRIEDLLANDGNQPSLGVNLTEEAAAVSRMTCRTTDLVHFDQQGIGVTVIKNPFELLNIPALFPFPPQFIATAAEVANPPRFQGFFKGGSIHVGKHQDIAGRLILGNHGNQFVSGKIGAMHFDHRSSLGSHFVLSDFVQSDAKVNQVPQS